MLYAEIIKLVMVLATKLQQDVADQKITVNELLDLVKAAVDDLGYGDKVILDLTENK